MPPRLNRCRIVVVAMVAVVLLGACASSSEPDAQDKTDEPAAYTEQKTMAGDVEVKAVPVQLDARGAVFDVAFDTHSVELDLDVAAGAALDVDGKAWTVAAWSGDGPGGHHREGKLRFDAAATPRKAATLSIAGLDEPVEFTWPIEGEVDEK